MEVEQIENNIQLIANNFIQEYGEQGRYSVFDICQYLGKNCPKFKFFTSCNGVLIKESSETLKYKRMRIEAADNIGVSRLYKYLPHREQNLASIKTIRKEDIAGFVAELLLPSKKEAVDFNRMQFEDSVSIAYSVKDTIHDKYFKIYDYSNLTPYQVKPYNELMQEKKKYFFLGELIASLKLSRVISDYLIDEESGILSYKIGENYFKTDIRMHAWQEVPNDYGPLRIKTRRIILKNFAREFVDKLIKEEADDQTLGLGGFIESEDNLSRDGNCTVLDNARVFGNAQVRGNAIIFHNAQVSGDAEISENALIFDNARVFGKSRVFGYAQVFGNAEVGNGFRSGYISVCYNYQVFGNAKFYRTVSGHEMQTQFFGDYEFNDRNFEWIPFSTTMNFISDSIKTGGYNFIVSNQEVASIEDYFYTGLRTIDGNICAYVGIPNNIYIKLGDRSLDRTELCKIKSNILSKCFINGVGKTMQAISTCLRNAGVNFKDYATVYKLISSKNYYDKFDIFEEFVRFKNVYKEERRLNPHNWQDNLGITFDRFVEKYIKINNAWYDPIKARLFADLKRNYFNIEFLNRFDEFSAIMEREKECFKYENRVQFEGAETFLDENTTIFAPNGVVIRSSPPDRIFLSGNLQILRRMRIDADSKINEQRNILAYTPKKRNIFNLIDEKENPAFEAIARYAISAKKVDIEGKPRFVDGLDIPSIVKNGLGNTRNGKGIL